MAISALNESNQAYLAADAHSQQMVKHTKEWRSAVGHISPQRLIILTAVRLRTCCSVIVTTAATETHRKYIDIHFPGDNHNPEHRNL